MFSDLKNSKTFVYVHVCLCVFIYLYINHIFFFFFFFKLFLLAFQTFLLGSFSFFPELCPLQVPLLKICWMLSVCTYLKVSLFCFTYWEFHCYIIQDKCSFSHYRLKIHPYCLLHPIAVIERSGVSLFVGYLLYRWPVFSLAF